MASILSALTLKEGDKHHHICPHIMEQGKQDQGVLLDNWLGKCWKHCRVPWLAWKEHCYLVVVLQWWLAKKRSWWVIMVMSIKPFWSTIIISSIMCNLKGSLFVRSAPSIQDISLGFGLMSFFPTFNTKWRLFLLDLLLLVLVLCLTATLAKNWILAGIIGNTSNGYEALFLMVQFAGHPLLNTSTSMQQEPCQVSIRQVRNISAIGSTIFIINHSLVFFFWITTLFDNLWLVCIPKFKFAWEIHLRMLLINIHKLKLFLQFSSSSNINDSLGLCLSDTLSSLTWLTPLGDP